MPLPMAWSTGMAGGFGKLFRIGMEHGLQQDVFIKAIVRGLAVLVLLKKGRRAFDDCLVNDEWTTLLSSLPNINTTPTRSGWRQRLTSTPTRRRRSPTRTSWSASPLRACGRCSPCLCNSPNPPLTTYPFSKHNQRAPGAA